MPFLAPLALAGLVFLPARRRDVPAQAAAGRGGRALHAAVAASWSRTSRRTPRGSGCAGACCCCSSCCSSLILVFLAARPFVERPAGLAGDIVLVIDTSASMQATDVTPNRLEAAKAAAIDALKDLPGGRQGQRDRGGADGQGRSPTAPATSAASGRRSTSITPTSDIGDLGDALRLASALAARSGDAEILVATDAALATPPAGIARGAGPRAPGGPRAERTRRSSRSPCGPRRAACRTSAFISVANLGPRAGRAAGPAVRGRPAARLARRCTSTRSAGPTSPSTTSTTRTTRRP